jgi:hypothetical protein
MFFQFANAEAQNEFAATGFYTDFNLIFEDSKTGFTNCKGEKRNSEFEELAAEYTAKLMLPLADSGKLVVPLNGNAYVIYYFEPDKVRLKVDQRAVNLRDAIIIALGKPLYSRTETTIINNYPFTTTLYYTEADEKMSATAVFRQCIYYRKGFYFLSLEIRGKRD